MKESLRHIDDRIVFRETFRDEQTVRRNGGVPTNINFNNGLYTNTRDDSILYSKVKLYAGEYSIRFIIKNNTPSLYTYYLTDLSNPANFLVRNSAASQGLYINASDAKYYINGSETKYFNTENAEVVFTFILNTDVDGIRIGNYVSNNGLLADFELVEIYQGILTSEEVKNLYNKSTYQELPDKIDEQLGSDLLDDIGEFDDPNDWDQIDSGWTISGGVAIANVPSGNAYVRKIIIGLISSGKKYRFCYEVKEYTSGTLIISSATLGTTKSLISTVGTYEVDLHPTISPTQFLFGSGGSGFIGIVDNIYVKEVIEGTGIEKILDVHSMNCVLEDKMGNTLTPTDIDIKKVGANVYSPEFNGLTSKIDCGNFDDLTGDLTILAWFNAHTFGENNLGRILANGKLELMVYQSNSRVRISSNGVATSVFSANNSITLNKYYYLAITRKSNGNATFYIGSSTNAPIQSGGADQYSGTPASGTTIFIGSNNDNNVVFDGKIPRLIIYKGLLSTEQITQFYTNTKRYYE